MQPPSSPLTAGKLSKNQMSSWQRLKPVAFSIACGTNEELAEECENACIRLSCRAQRDAPFVARSRSTPIGPMLYGFNGGPSTRGKNGRSPRVTRFPQVLKSCPETDPKLRWRGQAVSKNLLFDNSQP
jgi:hypothetical protein